jgi:molybdopterin-guanine dinucleotide biosynthesis protein A
MQWVQRQPNAAGVLVPVVDDKRMLYDISHKTMSPFEARLTEEAIEVGKFKFSKSVFEKAQAVLLEAAHQQHDWLIIDEIGKLELHFQSGLEPAASKAIEWFKKGNTRTKLLLVIRDYLLDEAIRFYGLENATVVSAHFFTSGLAGLVLCGGKSERMGTDKSLIAYGNEPQLHKVHRMLAEGMENVFVSINASQASGIHGQYGTIADAAEFKNAGPMTGLLSAFQKFPDKPFFVMGCDYPFFGGEDMNALIEGRDGACDAVCYASLETGIDEPLLTIYEKSCGPLLLKYFMEGNRSLRYFLQTVKTKRLAPLNPLAIKSVDTKEAWEKLRL